MQSESYFVCVFNTLFFRQRASLSRPLTVIYHGKEQQKKRIKVNCEWAVLSSYYNYKYECRICELHERAMATMVKAELQNSTKISFQWVNREFDSAHVVISVEFDATQMLSNANYLSQLWKKCFLCAASARPLARESSWCRVESAKLLELKLSINFITVQSQRGNWKMKKFQSLLRPHSVALSSLLCFLFCHISIQIAPEEFSQLSRLVSSWAHSRFQIGENTNEMLKKK